MLTQKDHKLLLLYGAIATIGNFDLLLFWFHAQTLLVALFGNQSTLYALTVLAVGYIARPLGAVVAVHHLSSKTQQLFWATLVLSTLSAVLAFLPSHALIGTASGAIFVFVRLLQGLVFAPVMPLVWTLCAERLPAQHQGLASGVILAMVMLGVLALMVLAMILQTLLTQDELLFLGWRFGFGIGAVLGFLSLLGLKHAKHPTTTCPTDLPRIGLSGLVPVLIFSWLIAATFALLAILMQPLVSMNFLVNDALLGVSQFLMLLFFVFGSVFFGGLSDRLQTGYVYATGCSFLMVSLFWLFYDLRHGGGLMLLTFTLTGFGAGIIGAMPAVMTRLCPKPYRLYTLSVGYNSVQALTGLFTPLMMGYLSFYSDFGPALYLCLVCLFVCFWGFICTNNPKNPTHPKYNKHLWQTIGSQKSFNQNA